MDYSYGNINALACVKAEIWHPFSGICTSDLLCSIFTYCIYELCILLTLTNYFYYVWKDFYESEAIAGLVII